MSNLFSWKLFVMLFNHAWLLGHHYSKIDNRMNALYIATLHYEFLMGLFIVEDAIEIAQMM